MTNKPYGIATSLIGICLSALPALMMASASAMAQPTAAAIQPAPLMDRQKEIALALSACPPSVASKAAVYVRGESGYVKVRDSENGFTAIAAFPPGQVAPMCMDAEGTRAVLPTVLKRSELRAQGKSPEEIKRVIADAFAKGELSPPARPGVNYMLSPHNQLINEKGVVVPFPPHVMVYAPYLTNADIGVGHELGPDGNLIGPATVFDEGTPQALIIVPVLQETQAGPGHVHQ